jgi:hypothetical protein
VSGGGTTPLRKFVRQGATYVLDTTFRAPTFVHWGVTYRADGRQIATDAYGNLYVANGMWMNPAPHVVTKYAPDGRLLAKFGDFTNTWNLGVFFGLSGIAVSRDGRHIYTSASTFAPTASTSTRSRSATRRRPTRCASATARPG